MHTYHYTESPHWAVKQIGDIYTVIALYLISDLFDDIICHSDYAAFGSRMTANNAVDSA